MDPILFLSLVIIMAAGLPWWPYSAYGRLRHHRPWDWLLDSPRAKTSYCFCISLTKPRPPPFQRGTMGPTELLGKHRKERR